MLPLERQRRIEAFLKSNHEARVTQLSKMLGISLATVRRDLAEMEEVGVIRRVHGGAVLADQKISVEPPVLQREPLNREYKRRIGQVAAGLVADGDIIIISSGTTTLELARCLGSKQNVTVITNALNIAYALSLFPELAVVVLGGYLRHSEFSLLGHLTEQALQGLYAVKLFIGAFALDSTYGLSGDYLSEVHTDQVLIAAASQVIVLADHTKLGQKHLVQVAPITAIHTLITDSDAPPEQIAAFKAAGLEVLLA
ncbi:MAG: DeoR/GlpR transcriptional regulator [Chloroflexi bacterium]|nr:DeoR/GlpR transcriptional regulator [Chloroflexota bacterium]